jgi:hypothetical protein
LLKWLAVAVVVLVEVLVVGALVEMVAILLLEAILQTVARVALYHTTRAALVELSLLVLEQGMELVGVLQVMEV